MSNNCLVTKLKSVVNNDNLEVYGSLDIVIPSNVNGTYLVNESDFPLVGNITIKTENGILGIPSEHDKYGNEVTVYPGFPTIVVVYPVDSSKPININYNSKYNVVYMPLIVGMNLSDVKYLVYLKRLIVENPVGQLANVENLTALTRLIFSGTVSVSGTLESVSGLTELTELGLGTGVVSGNINLLGNLTKLTTLNSFGGLLTGSIEGFVAAQRTNNRTTASNILINVGNSQVTWKGNVVGAGQKSLSWTATTITYNGETIEA